MYRIWNIYGMCGGSLHARTAKESASRLTLISSVLAAFGTIGGALV